MDRYQKSSIAVKEYISQRELLISHHGTQLHQLIRYARDRISPLCKWKAVPVAPPLLSQRSLSRICAGALNRKRRTVDMPISSPAALLRDQSRPVDSPSAVSVSCNLPFPCCQAVCVSSTVDCCLGLFVSLLSRIRRATSILFSSPLPQPSQVHPLLSTIRRLGHPLLRTYRRRPGL